MPFNLKPFVAKGKSNRLGGWDFETSKLSEVPSQNQLAIGGVAHQLIYKARFMFLSEVGQLVLSHLNTPPQVQLGAHA